MRKIADFLVTVAAICCFLAGGFCFVMAARKFVTPAHVCPAAPDPCEACKRRTPHARECPNCRALIWCPCCPTFRMPNRPTGDAFNQEVAPA